MSYLADTPQKLSLFIKSEIQLFRLGIQPKPYRFQSHIPSNRWHIPRIFHIWKAPVGYEELKANQKTFK